MTNFLNINNLMLYLSSYLTKTSDQLLSEQLGLSYSQYKIMQVVLDRKEITQSELALILYQSEASINRQVGILLEKKFLGKVDGIRDKRQNVLLLTILGEQVTEAADKIVSVNTKKCLAVLEESETSDLADYLKKVHYDLSLK